MKRPESRAGNWGWAGLVAGVIAWDVLAPETLSNAVDRYMEKPLGRLACLGVVALTGAHLLNIMPEEYDVVNKIGDGLGLIKKVIDGQGS